MSQVSCSILLAAQSCSTLVTYGQFPPRDLLNPGTEPRSCNAGRFLVRDHIKYLLPCLLNEFLCLSECVGQGGLDTEYPTKEANRTLQIKLKNRGT